MRLVAASAFAGAEWAVEVEVGVGDIDDIVNDFAIGCFDFLIVAIEADSD